MNVSVLTLAELITDPLDQLLRADADPVERVRRPGVLEHGQALTEQERITTLAARAWDSRIAPLPKTEADPRAVTFAARLHEMAGLVKGRAECEDHITAVGLPDPAVSLGADLLLLAAIRQDVIANEALGCPVCRRPWAPHPADSGAPS